MKNAKKVIVLALCAILLVAASVMGTLAYLTSTATVQNTFTAGNVTITMVESDVDEYGKNPNGTANANEYKLVPGHTYTKDPTITVGADSEDCYIFVKIENGLGNAATIVMDTTNWTLVNGTLSGTSVWVYGTATNAVAVTKNSKVTPFSTFTFGANANPADYVTASNENAKIAVTAYAIQADTLDSKTPADIWALFNVQ